MITVMVEFQFPNPVPAAQQQALSLGSVSKYQDMAGLIRKYYWFSEDGTRGGGIYLWATREAADGLYTDEWRATVRQRYGCEPRVSYMATPVVVDNLSHQVVTAG